MLSKKLYLSRLIPHCGLARKNLVTALVKFGPNLSVGHAETKGSLHLRKDCQL